ncbi:S8 family serine peptidase [Calidithermus terrae]|nr:S8 family serine peptidase [Calidithermus terrae]
MEPYPRRRTRTPTLGLVSGLALLLLLAACGGEEGEGDPASQTYTLTAVESLPAAPGDTLTAYGTLPQSLTLSLEGGALAAPLALTPTPVQGGVRFTLPATLLAGQPTLYLRWEQPDAQGKTSLSAPLAVVPRVEGAALSGRTLYLSGRGWPATPEGLEAAETLTRLEVDGLQHPPGLEGGRLVHTLPESQGYGRLTLRVWVAGQASAPYSLDLEAGAVKGSVALPAGAGQRLPATGTGGETGSRAGRPGGERQMNALVVRHEPGALELPGRLEARAWGPGLRRRAGLVLRPRGGRGQDQDRGRGVAFTRLEFATPAQAEAARRRLEGRPGVLGVEHDAVVRLEAVAAQAACALTPPEAALERQWHLPLMGLPAAWGRTRGEGVVVAVVDTGVLPEHPDLAPSLLPGYDFADDDPDPADTAGHGTHVAGLIAAQGKVRGAAPGAKVVPVRVIAEDSTSAFTLAQGLLWAAGLDPERPNPNRPQLINLSLGTEAYSEVLAQAVQAVRAEGIALVAAAGNSGRRFLSYPAALPGVIAVTALAGPRSAYQPPYANRGEGLWLSAYGGDPGADQDGDGVCDALLSTDLAAGGQAGYGLRAGTSMAAPLVSGVAALALASGTRPDLLRPTLAGTAADLGVLGYDLDFGHGLATGRAATPGTPRTYLLALGDDGRPVAWTLVQPDLSYTLSNLPAGQPLALVAASDADGDRRLGEAGELISAPRPFTPRAGETLGAEPLALEVADGGREVYLF